MSTAKLRLPARAVCKCLAGACFRKRVIQNVPLEERYIKLGVRSGDPLTVLGVLQSNGVELLSDFSCHIVGFLPAWFSAIPHWKIYRKVSNLGFLFPFVSKHSNIT